MADRAVRQLKRKIRSGDISLIPAYVAECRRVEQMPEHDIAVQHIASIIRSVPQNEEIDFNQLGMWVIEALSVNVALFTDDDLRYHHDQDRTGGTDWFILPTSEQLTTLRTRHRSFEATARYSNLEWNPALLLAYWEDNRNEGVYEINREWELQPRFIKIDPKVTYSDAIILAKNPPHMVYGECNCRGCVLREFLFD